MNTWQEQLASVIHEGRRALASVDALGAQLAAMTAKCDAMKVTLEEYADAANWSRGCSNADYGDIDGWAHGPQDERGFDLARTTLAEVEK